MATGAPSHAQQPTTAEAATSRQASRGTVAAVAGRRQWRTPRTYRVDDLLPSAPAPNGPDPARAKHWTNRSRSAQVAPTGRVIRSLPAWLANGDRGKDPRAGCDPVDGATRPIGVPIRSQRSVWDGAVGHQAHHDGDNARCFFVFAAGHRAAGAGGLG